MNNFSGACPKCGEAIEKSSTKFCRGCGTSVERFIEFDNPAHLRSYEEAAFALLSDGDTSVDDPRLEHLRSRLLISQSYRQSILANLHKQIQSVKPLSNFRVEFDSNVQDALVNGDTLLRFRFTNLSDSEQLKLEICWDDPELPEDQDFKVFTRGFCKPRNNESLIQTHVFRRPGRKSITGILAHITNLYGDKATFNLSPIEFFVASPNQTLVQHTTTNTSISIEGRGVIDASGVAANAAGTHDPALKSHWVALQHTHKYESLLNKTPAQEDLEELAATLTNHQATKGDQNEKVVVNTNSVKAIEVDKEIVTVGLNGVTPTDLEPRSPLGQSLTKEIREGDRRNSEDELTRPPRLRENIEQLFDSFVALDVSEGGAERRVLLASSWSLNLIGKLLNQIPDCNVEALVGACFPDPHALRVNTRDQLESFDGDATFFTDRGLYTLSSKRRNLKLAMHLSWLDAEENGVNFYIKKFGSSSFIVEFGDSSAQTFLPGCQFDLRQYQGRPSVQEILKSARKRLTDVCSSYEQSLAILNNQSVTSEDLQQIPAETPASKAFNSEMTEAHESDDANQQTIRAVPDEVEPREVKKPGFEIVELVGKEVHANELLLRFLNLYGFCMQGCVNENPRAIFTINNIDISHLDTLYSDLTYRGPHLCALSMEPHSAMVTQDGKLSQWTGSSSAISIEGIFHVKGGEDGVYQLEGEDYFLPWDSFFGMLNGTLIIRDRAPDLWLGTQNRYFIRGCYRDFSQEVIQWNYFQESILSELVALFGEVKRVLGKTP